MSESELREYFDIYTECWKMFRKYSSPVDADEFWQSLVNEGENIVNKASCKELAKKIVLATIDEIERIHREIRKNRQNGRSEENSDRR